MSLNAIADLPFISPPPGETSNFENPESRAHIAIIVCSICLALVWPIVLVRLYTKMWVTRTFGWDDAATVLAVIGSTSYTAAVIWGMNVYGPHGWNVRALAFTEQFIQIEVAIWYLVYGPTTFFAKMALFLLYLRIFSCSRRIRNMIYFGIIINGLFYAAITLIIGIQCVQGPGQTWRQASASDRCKSTLNLVYIQGGFGVISDLNIFILPLPTVWRLHMPVRRKVGVSAIFLTGFIAVLASIVGLYYRVLATWKPDFTWNGTPALTLAVVELNIGVMCGSMPHLPSFFRRHQLNISRITSLRHLPTKIWKNWKKGLSVKLSDFNRVHPISDVDPLCIETNILGSMKGDGKFLRSQNVFRQGMVYYSLEPLREQQSFYVED